MKRENLADEQLLNQWAILVLPYLSARDLAAAACACGTLSHIAAGVTSRRIADAARGFERYQIPFFNTISPHPYSYFLYAPHSILSPSPPSISQPWGGEELEGIATSSERLQSLSSCFGGFGVGCDCDWCEEGRCPCWSNMESGVVKECGESCPCDLVCENRKTQSGIQNRLKIVRGERKGWGLHVSEAIRKGDFVCEYAGIISLQRFSLYTSLVTCILHAQLPIN
jgi:[histone H3]-lysine36 N-dimethyltransferase SETMAR